MTSIQRIRPQGLISSPAFSHVAIVPPGATYIYVGCQNAVDAPARSSARETWPRSVPVP